MRNTICPDSRSFGHYADYEERLVAQKTIVLISWKSNYVILKIMNTSIKIQYLLVMNLKKSTFILYLYWEYHVNLYKLIFHIIHISIRWLRKISTILYYISNCKVNMNFTVLVLIFFILFSFEYFWIMKIFRRLIAFEFGQL